MLDPDVKYNILSMDGGPAAPVQIRILRKIEAKYPGFLAETDMFAGTSDGAVLTAFLASRLPEDKAEAKRISLDIIDDAIQLSNITIRALQPRPWSMLQFMTGFGPLVEYRRMEAALQYAFGDMKIRDINRRILIASYDCNNWTMGNFTNVDILSQQADMPVYEAILASASLPLYAPVYRASNGRKFLDGVFVGNNPSLVATGTLLQSIWLTHHFAENTTEWHKIVERVRILSMGVGEVHAEAQRPIESIPSLCQQLFGIDWLEEHDGSLRWGWWQWLLERPALLASIVYHSQSAATALEGDMFLTPYNHHRYAPPSNTISVVFDLARRNADKVIQEAEQCAEELWANDARRTKGFGSDNPTTNMLRFIKHRWMKPGGQETWPKNRDSDVE
ncbi:MAG TPA: patatin-like phospholipase family protein [Polyangium sp.]|nr:patatin-like phospholipase family protein [Polyangium sp.]